MVSVPNKLGPYEIQRLLGAGGMGEVYKARDPRIGRDVAIKILPSAYSKDPMRLMRFQQEARTAGMLNHPNILAIYDLGLENETPFLVSELLEGETLRKVIERSALPLRKAMDYSLQTLNGLAAAHGKGIIHRDLKPENLFITKDGRVKILDFGLAKLIEPPSMSSEQSNLETENFQSEAGTLLGTLGYMSPEQLRGVPADQRADIFTFGAIFYEMITGKRAFHGQSTADTISAILHKDPADLSGDLQNIPAGLRQTIERCMAKDPAGRFQSTQDLSFALEALSGSSGSVPHSVDAIPSIQPIRRKVPYFWIFLTILLLSTATIFSIAYFRKASPSYFSSVVRFVNPLQEGIFAANTSLPIVSPDGRRIVFQASDLAGNRQLYLREMDSLTSKKLPGTAGVVSAFWSPDSRSLGFFSQGKLNTIDIETGTVLPICDASVGKGGTWNNENTIVFSPYSNSPLFRVSARGGKPEPVTELDRKTEVSHRWPFFLPDGKHFLFLSTAERTVNGIYVGSLDSKEKKFLVSSDMNAVFSPPDWLFFLRQSTLMVQKLDPKSLELVGEEHPLLAQIGFVGATGQAAFSVSNNGILAYRQLLATQNHITIINRQGNTSGVIGPEGTYEDPVLSPDGTRLAITRDDVGSAQSIWIYNFERNTFSRFTFSSIACDDPAWSPDGSKIIYSGDGNIYMKSTSGTQEDVLLYQDQFDKVPLNWSKDGRTLLFSIAAPITGLDLGILPLQGKPYPLLHSDYNEVWGQFLQTTIGWLTHPLNQVLQRSMYTLFRI